MMLVLVLSCFITLAQMYNSKSALLKKNDEVDHNWYLGHRYPPKKLRNMLNSSDNDTRSLALDLEQAKKSYIKLVEINRAMATNEQREKARMHSLECCCSTLLWSGLLDEFERSFWFRGSPRLLEENQNYESSQRYQSCLRFVSNGELTWFDINASYYQEHSRKAADSRNRLLEFLQDYAAHDCLEDNMPEVYHRFCFSEWKSYRITNHVRRDQDFGRVSSRCAPFCVPAEHIYLNSTDIDFINRAAKAVKPRIQYPLFQLMGNKEKPLVFAHSCNANDD